MNRKKFLINSALAAFSLSAVGSVVPDKEDGFTGDCDTTKDILGPFYRPDAPMRQDLLFEKLKGSRILVKGKVYTDDCQTPLKDALVEIWHCDTEGNYDNESTKYLHRAAWKSDRNGAYSFRTIIPGKYLNGGAFRPSHIHFRVTAEGHKELVSQIYFKGDPHIEADRWASSESAKLRVLEIFPENEFSDLTVNFDIYLRS